MIRYLLTLGLIVIPFAIVPGMDMRTPKEIIALFIALALGLVAIYEGKMKAFRNNWILLFVGFFIVSMVFSPSFSNFVLGYVSNEGDNVRKLSVLANRNISGFWAFKPFLFAIVYLLMTVSLASAEFTKIEVKKIFAVMMWCGFAMSCYIFIQRLHLDQFFAQVPDSVDQSVKHMRAPLLGGFIGHATLVSPYIAMIIPLALYLRKYIISTIMIVAVVLTNSAVAITAMIISLITYLILSKRKEYKIIGFIALAIVMLSLGSIKIYKSQYMTANYLTSRASGRFGAWQNILKDFTSSPIGKTKKFTVTGFGPGSFEYAYSVRNDNLWVQAHNEALEVLYNFGIVGLFLLIMALYHTFNYAYIWGYGEIPIALTGSLICILLCSLGTFSFHIAPTMFYTTVVIAFLHNKNIIGGRYGY